MSEIFAYQKITQESAVIQLDKAASKVGQSRTKLILLVAKPSQGKTQILQRLASVHNQKVLSLGLIVAKALQEEIKPDKLVGYLRTIAEEAGSLLLLDNIEVLFQPSLELKALEVLKMLSQERVIIAAFPGKVVGGSLVYGEAFHPEYKMIPQYEVKDLVIFDLNGE